MKWRFWERAVVPAPSGECQHLWSNWSEPGACRITTVSFLYSAESTERDGWAQDRHCLQCNLYQRRVA